MVFKDLLHSKVILFDGAMGTMLQSRGLKTGELPEILNLKSPDLITKIHQLYLAAGADVLTTNTFGANALKLQGVDLTVEEVIKAAVKNAKEARGEEKALIALDIGPLGELLEPLGTLSFTAAYDLFTQQILCGVKAGVDLILIETMTDLYEAKAAVLAAREHSNLPVLCTMSFEEDQRTFTGCTLASMVMTLEGLGVDALGLNCSLGPKELEPLVEEILTLTNLPILLQPNAGLPEIVAGETVFKLNPEQFADYGLKFAKLGARLLGGCCGTTEKHIRALQKSLVDLDLPSINNKRSKRLSGVCTPTKVVQFDQFRVVGERINPTGKKEFKVALGKKDLDYLVKEAIIQVEAKADILDINVGLPEIDEVEMMVKVIKEIQAVADIPLQIDSSNPKVIEAGLRAYNGKALVNSVNGEEESLESILPLVKKYGAAVIALTLDEKGIPNQAEGRLKIAKKIVQRAAEYGISKEDIIIDCLTLTAAAQQENVKETIKAIELVRSELGVKTILGVSNVSFGLPNRGLLNKTFLAASLYAGLDLAIIDPLDQSMMDTVAASKVLWNIDPGAVEYLQRHQDLAVKNRSQNQEIEKSDLTSIILQGLRQEASLATKNLLLKKEPLEIIDQLIIPALDVIGKQYETGEIFLPQLIRSAETVKNAFEIIKESLSEAGLKQVSKGKIILATVKGDIHDIGKNIVKVLLENYNYEVLDLGKDVATKDIISAATEHNVKLVGLSALMTTTVKNMAETIAALKAMDQNIQVMVGGAVLNDDYAQMIGSDYYGQSAQDAITIARDVLG